MDAQNHLLHAAKWLLLAVESTDPQEQGAILDAAEASLAESERTRKQTRKRTRKRSRPRVRRAGAAQRGAAAAA